ncbi:TetR/AcrR family transcriptional regulator [Corynebacterium kalidii]|uniref:TetR/AcrR family transcriptional regulator n=1 Tax=Corynebacterium kalidii TaxID=2931982 RepID=A0A9X1WIQ2_9CORY|nr:TetR/AcrR family transcriptional regulator [Corynebacterium kalidii]
MQRREQIVDAVLSVATESGLNAVTIARVASTARVSVGLVQHYFDSKESLLRSSYEACLDRIGSRVEALVEQGEHARLPIRDMITAGLAQLLPLDAERKSECRLRQEFLGLAAQNPQLTSTARDREMVLLRQVETAITNGKECGEVAPDHDAVASATTILTVCHGIMIRSGLGIGPDLAPLESAIDMVFDGSCSRSIPAR